MKILINCLSSVSGGAVSYLRNLIPELVGVFEQSDEEHQVKILCHEHQRQLFPTISDSHCIIITDSYKAGYHRVLWEYSHLSSVLHKERVNVLFIPYQIGPKITGVKQVLMLRNMEPFLFHRYRYSLKTWLRNSFLNLMSSYSLTRADRIIAVSEFAKEYAINRLNIAEEKFREFTMPR
ncbi:MAG: glycosyltransferase family 4 protein [Desulfobacteraceae bacterium]|nr:glycosyltransferase family 4 protein [Desulfobacteraceae bacterium]